VQVDGFAPEWALHPLTSDVTPLLFADRKPGQEVGQLSEAACRHAHHFEWRTSPPLPMVRSCRVRGRSGGATRAGAGPEVLR
jgi:hypothetical protein